MRLINTASLELEEFFGTPKDEKPHYAILSHTWAKEEVTLRDFRRGTAAKKAGYKKILQTCELALKDGWPYAWIDTCCIDKSSSSELSEAINSMFAWYKTAAVCYVYLEDVDGDNKEEWELSTDSHLTDREARTFNASDLAKSRWFSRGWTLQELLAPSELEFYDKEWRHIGDLFTLAAQVSYITGIERRAFASLNGDPKALSQFSIAQKMSWASKRRTTREEDIAYCLLGIFDVNLPLIYGEGKNAFLRLQEEIAKRSSDQTLFAWWSNDDETGSLLASSPANFENCNYIVPWKSEFVPSTFSLTNDGLLVDLPLVPADDLEHGTMLAVLNCRDLHNFVGPLGLRVRTKDKPIMINGISIAPSSDSNKVREFIVTGTSRTSTVRRVIPTFDGFVDLISRGNYSPQRLLIRREAQGATETPTGSFGTTKPCRIVINERVHNCLYDGPDGWLSFGSNVTSARTYPSTCWKRSGHWSVIFPSADGVHAAAEIRWRSETVIFVFGVDILKDEAGAPYERPWLQIQKKYWHDLRNIPPPKMEKRRGSANYTFYHGDILNAGLYSCVKMGEVVYELRSYYVHELDLNPVRPRPPTPPTPPTPVEDEGSVGEVPKQSASRSSRFLRLIYRPS